MRPGGEIGAAILAPLLALVLVVAPAAPVWAQTAAPKPRSRQEESRRKLLEGMGLEKKEAAPTAEPAPEPAAEAASPGSPGEGQAGSKTGDKPGGAMTAAPRVAGPSFRRVIHPLLMQTCKVCHTPGAPAAATHLLLSGDAAADHAAVARLVNVRTPADSLLLAKVSGQKIHAGGAPWADDSGPYARMLAWIQAGARLDAGPAAEAPPAAAAVMPLPRAGRSVGGASPATAAGTPAVTAPDATAAAGAAVAEVPGSAPPIPRGVDFVTDVHPVMMRLCSACHGPAGPAAITHLVLTGDASKDYLAARALVDVAAPPNSPLLVKGSGQAHVGGPIIPAGSPGHALILSWVVAGAPLTSPVVAQQRGGAPCTPAPPVCLPAVAAGPVGSPGPGTSPGVGARGWNDLPYGFQLNGRFDVAYERRGYTGDPFKASAVNALRSYHHFLFLSRESADDPIGLSVEVLSLQFWEAHYRWTAAAHPIQVVFAAGKLLVPFGADPLMHQSYGGLVGFDQKILPVIWAQEGVAGHLLWHRRELAVTDDLYIVRGYQLRAADGVLNLQNDFSPDDSSRLGIGDRLGGAWGPLSAWYSAYFNNLGFSRHLFMQAADVMLWRMRGIPVLEHFSFAAGLLRADVSGGGAEGTGGPGKDYYHFGSYFQVRFHPNDWLYVQYREGLRTFDNRRGLIIDDTRLTSADASTHSFGVVARWGGLSGGAFYFINLEKGPEIPDDFLRVSLTYDF